MPEMRMMSPGTSAKIADGQKASVLDIGGVKRAKGFDHSHGNIDRSQEEGSLH